MSGVHVVTRSGPDTHTVSATVTGGQLVMPDGSNPGQVKPTTGAVAGVLGVALTDAVPAGSGSNTAFGTAPPTTSVAYGPCTVPLTAAGNISFGDLVTAGAAGGVLTVGASTFDKVIGRCVEPLGITSAATGRIRLFG